MSGMPPKRLSSVQRLENMFYAKGYEPNVVYETASQSPMESPVGENAAANSLSGLQKLENMFYAKGWEPNKEYDESDDRVFAEIDRTECQELERLFKEADVSGKGAIGKASLKTLMAQRLTSQYPDFYKPNPDVDEMFERTPDYVDFPMTVRVYITYCDLLRGENPLSPRPTEKTSFSSAFAAPTSAASANGVRLGVPTNQHV
eukprot:GFYU01012541.1.p1 GENE.GFYU01012541.1~~GFYU01012541.1.p1  ORF type:complete len:203 (+),score=22.21 GFYU01012541.1:160-768(+)